MLGYLVLEPNMPDAKRTPGIVPRVFAEDGGGYAVAAKCCLCGARIVKRDLCYGHLATDPPGLTRPLHVRCKREFELFTRAMSI
jgi:hypothetical protein